MVPKVIHYCWFGRGRKSSLAEKCMASWHKYLPDYEIKEWNEDNFDVNMIPYTKEAYAAKKYAFVSDFARFWILYHYGGLYFDVDVELIRPMDEILENGPFMACEDDSGVYSYDLVAPGLGLGANIGMPLYKTIIEYYEREHFLLSEHKMNLDTVVDHITKVLKNHGWSPTECIQEVYGVTVYPHEYFCPIRIADGKLYITEKTVSIHHYAASWTSPTHRFLRAIIIKIGGYRLKKMLSYLKDFFSRT